MTASVSGAPSRFERYAPAPVATAAGWSISTLVAPARLFSANGVRLAPDGRCWVAEVWGGAISAWDADSGEITTVSPTGGPLSGPDDLALGSDGAVYVTEYLDGRVAAVGQDGSYDVLVEESPKANGITVDRDGRVFVDEFRDGGRLYELDPRRPGRPRVIAELDFPNALERGPDGRLYVQNAAKGTICSVDPDSGDVRSEFSGLRVPSAVKFDRSGRLVVCDFVTGSVLAFDLGSREPITLAQLSSGLDNFCFDRQGRLFVSNAITCEVVRVDGGRVDATTGSGFVGPCGLCADGEGAVLVADDLRVARVAPGSAPVSMWDPSFDGWSHRIVDVAWAAGALFAVTGAGETVRIRPETGDVRVLYRPAVGEESVAVAPYGAGVVVGTQHGVLLEFTAEGTVAGSRPAGLPSVTAVACRQGTIVACDRGTGRIVVTDGDGTRLLAHCSQPESVAVLGREAFVGEADQRRIIRISLDSGTCHVVATGLPIGYPRPHNRRQRRSALTTLPDGSLVVGCDGDGSLRRLWRG